MFILYVFYHAVYVFCKFVCVMIFVWAQIDKYGLRAAFTIHRYRISTKQPSRTILQKMITDKKLIKHLFTMQKSLKTCIYTNT